MTDQNVLPFPVQSTTDHTLKGPGKPAYGTPPEILEVVRVLLGNIDLDPCSSPQFNLNVRATQFFTEQDNGIEHRWQGNVYLNPPGGRARPGARAWWDKLCQEYKAGNVGSAVYMSFALDSFQWSQAKGRTPVLAFPTVIFAKRIRFTVEGPEGFPVATKSPSKPNALTWLPPATVSPGERINLVALFASLLTQAGHECIPIVRV